MLIIVRHAAAEIAVPGGPPEEVRPLSDLGRVQANELTDELLAFDPRQVVSSPFRRAVETVEPLAERLGRPLELRDELREWEDGLETRSDWRDLYLRCWNDPDLRYGTGETHRELGARAGRVLRELIAEAEGSTVVAASHGTWISRGLEALGFGSTFDFWLQMPKPAVYALEVVDGRVIVRGPGIDGTTQPSDA